ncbi:MAG: 4Fe-4S binding protein [Smithellaceae bacterium]|nr:4Fe-4S binding protein [Smithellaceae bacterium]
MKRKIINIDEEKCNGCSLCLPNCPEGALQIIEGKARLVSDLFCDGLGACLGHCPEGAITIEEREAEPYDERQVMENIVKQGPEVVKAHLQHLRDHNEAGYLKEAMDYLRETKNLPAGLDKASACGCPGMKATDFQKPEGKETATAGQAASELSQWPIQFHLVSPMAPYFQKADLVLAADCTAFALGSFHADYLKGKRLIIACPKLDSDQEIYLEKLVALIDEAKINTLTVVIMEVPCCGGLLNLAKRAMSMAKRKVPIKSVIVGVRGEVLNEDWV